MQSNPDGDYKWILVYEDHLTKYCVLLPGKTKTAQETAEKLKFIFSMLSAPVILQSDNGREFVNQVKLSKYVNLYAKKSIFLQKIDSFAKSSSLLYSSSPSPFLFWDNFVSRSLLHCWHCGLSAKWSTESPDIHSPR